MHCVAGQAHAARRQPATPSTQRHTLTQGEGRIRDVVIVGSGPAGYTAAIYAARAGLDHDLRHTRASWHVMSGTRLQELMELGGGKSFEMVLCYAHLAPEHLSQAAGRIERNWEIVERNPTISLR
jgi:integrase